MNDQRPEADPHRTPPTGPLWHGSSATPAYGTPSTGYPGRPGREAGASNGGGGHEAPPGTPVTDGAGVGHGGPADPVEPAESLDPRPGAMPLAHGTGRPPTKGHGSRTPLLVGGMAVLLLVGGVAGAYLLDRTGTSAADPTLQNSAQQRFPVDAAPVQQASASAPDWVATAAAAAPSVVSITVSSGSQGGQGSGVILDKQGHIVTNHHVVAAGMGSAGASRETILVTLNDKRAYQAKVVGSDPATDLAVLELNDGPGDLTPISLGDDSKLQVGSPVMAVGNPLGLAGTVTTGIVSALNRPVTTRQQSPDPSFGGAGEYVVTNAIQTSAAINPGNSGGALVNASGQLVGINSSIAQTSQDGGNIGIGFAIPVNAVRSVTDQILRNGTVKHAYIGVTGKGGYVKDGSARRAAAIISEVTADSPAAKASLQAGDAVVAIDDELIDSWESLVAQVRERPVGSSITLTVLRDGKRTDIKVALAERPNSLP